LPDAPLAATGWYPLAVAGGQVFGGFILALPLLQTLLTLELGHGYIEPRTPAQHFAAAFPSRCWQALHDAVAGCSIWHPFMETGLPPVSRLLKLYKVSRL
jgi:hypothetical protein